MAPRHHPGLVEIVASPGSRLWAAVWIGLALAVLSLSLGYSAAETLYAMRRLVLEAVYPR